MFSTLEPEIITERRTGPGQLYPLMCTRLWKHGKTLMFPVHSGLVDALRCGPRDLVLIRMHLPFVTFRIVEPYLSLPIGRFDHPDLPPSYKELLETLAKGAK